MTRYYNVIDFMFSLIDFGKLNDKFISEKNQIKLMVKSIIYGIHKFFVA